MDRILELQKMLEDQPKDSFVRFALAKEYSNKGDHRGALRQYTALQQADPEYVGVYYHMGKAMEELDLVQQATLVYKAGIAVAERLQDLHAKSELQSALLNAEMEL